jgi:hypothetical protein
MANDIVQSSRDWLGSSHKYTRAARQAKLADAAMAGTHQRPSYRLALNGFAPVKLTSTTASLGRPSYRHHRNRALLGAREFETLRVTEKGAS